MGLPAGQQRILDEIEQALRAEDPGLESAFAQFTCEAGGPALPSAERLARSGWNTGAGGWPGPPPRGRQAPRRLAGGDRSGARRARRGRPGPGGVRRVAILLALLPAVLLSVAGLFLLNLPLPQRSCVSPGCAPARTVVPARVPPDGPAARRPASHSPAGQRGARRRGGAAPRPRGAGAWTGGRHVPDLPPALQPP